MVKDDFDSTLRNVDFSIAEHIKMLNLKIEDYMENKSHNFKDRVKFILERCDKVQIFNRVAFWKFQRYDERVQNPPTDVMGYFNFRESVILSTVEVIRYKELLVFSYKLDFNKEYTNAFIDFFDYPSDAPQFIKIAIAINDMKSNKKSIVEIRQYINDHKENLSPSAINALKMWEGKTVQYF